MFLYFHTFVSFWYIFYFHLFIIYVSDYVLLYMWLDVCVCLCVNVCIACLRAWIVIYIVLLTVWGEAGDAYSVASTSQAHRAGSFGKRRTLSIFHGFDIHNGYLKPHNWSIFRKKKPPKGEKILILLQWNLYGGYNSAHWGHFKTEVGWK